MDALSSSLPFACGHKNKKAFRPRKILGCAKRGLTLGPRWSRVGRRERRRHATARVLFRLAAAGNFLQDHVCRMGWQVVHGEWSCGACGTQGNWKKRIQCRQCGALQVQEMQQQQGKRKRQRARKSVESASNKPEGWFVQMCAQQKELQQQIASLVAAQTGTGTKQVSQPVIALVSKSVSPSDMDVDGDGDGESEEALQASVGRGAL
eukprot:5107645-Amphidinium_carterae.1